MTTLSELRTELRNRLDESSARFWEDTELNTYINRGLKDVGRRTETLLTYVTDIMVTAGFPKYPLPNDVLRIHRVEFVPVNTTDTYPVEARSHQEMDQYWGVRQSITQSYPNFYVLWGITGIDASLQLYPVPSQAGQLNIYYYRVPAELTSDSQEAEIPAGWDDLVVLYAEYEAMRKDRDPRWQDAKQLYETGLSTMIDLTRELHDQAQYMYVGRSAVPWYLYEFDD